jgi:hypothetical protein
MTRKIILSVLLSSSVLGVLVATHSQRWSALQSAQNSSEQITGRIEEHALYPDVTEEELFARADISFVGCVMGFSDSFWNRDNNEGPASVKEWESGVGDEIYHYVKLKVTQPILGVKAQQVISVLKGGPSPQASTVKMGQGSFYSEAESSSLKVGSKGIFLIVAKAKVLWKSSSGKLKFKPATTFAAPLFSSYLPERKGKFDLAGEWVTPALVQQKFQLYEPMRDKQRQELDKLYRKVEKQVKARGW